MSRPQQNSGIYTTRQGVGPAPWSERQGTHFLDLPRRTVDRSSSLVRIANDRPSCE